MIDDPIPVHDYLTNWYADRTFYSNATQSENGIINTTDYYTSSKLMCGIYCNPLNIANEPIFGHNAGKFWHLWTICIPLILMLVLILTSLLKCPEQTIATIFESVLISREEVPKDISLIANEQIFQHIIHKPEWIEDIRQYRKIKEMIIVRGPIIVPDDTIEHAEEKQMDALFET